MDAIEGIASPQSNYEAYKDRFDNSKRDLITMENFYELLVAEMQNQDPLEPTSNTEFISQMASFTALQAQQDAFDVQNQQYANSLIGKTVTVKEGQDRTITGMVTSVTSGKDPQLMVNGKNYKLSSMTRVHQDETQTAGTIADSGAFASSLLGKTVLVKAFGEDGKIYYDEGEVQSLEIENGTVRLVLNGYSYDVSDVVKVMQTQQTQTAQAVQQTDTDDDAIRNASENNTIASAASQGQAVQPEQAQQDAEPAVEDIIEIEAANNQQLRELFS